MGKVIFLFLSDAGEAKGDPGGAITVVVVSIGSEVTDVFGWDSWKKDTVSTCFCKEFYGLITLFS